ncbi:MAG: gas vesicle protein GvpG [Actinomycetota bacterium]
MGLITKLVTAPLAPVRGVLWLTERIAEAAERELYDEATIRRRLAELQEAHDAGGIGDREFAEAEDSLLARLTQARRERR